MSLQQLYLETGMNKVEHAIHLLQVWEPLDGYYLAFSGGKDSVVIHDLATRAGVKFDAHYCVSPIDPPQIYKFIKENYPGVQWDNHAKGFWKLVTKKGLPRMNARWCCQIIKETGGRDRTIILGNRHAESVRRSKQCFVTLPHNAPTKKLKRENKTLVRPILHFTDWDVWEYIRMNNLPYCSLYDEGAAPEDHGYGKGVFKRIGCVLCPFSRNIEREEKYFPKIVKNWKLACDRIVARYKKQGYVNLSGKPMAHRFETGEELYKWWITK